MSPNKHQEKIVLPAQVRTVLGKKSKQLRKQGLLLGNIFGSQTKPVALTIQEKDFTSAYHKAKETGVIEIHVGKDIIPTLVYHIQKHPVNDAIIHIDFRKVDLTKKIETLVPVVVTGTSEAVAQKGGILLTQSNHIMVEALPQDIPSEISVDIAALKEIGQEITIANLPVSETYRIKEDPTKVVVSVTAHKEESITPETTAATPEVITAAPVEGAEGESVEGKTPAASAKPEEKTSEKSSEQ